MSASDKIKQLNEIQNLLESKVITQEEFDALKAEIFSNTGESAKKEQAEKETPKSEVVSDTSNLEDTHQNGELMNYIKQVYDTEKDLYMLTNMMQTLESEKESFEEPAKIAFPSKPLENKISDKDYEYNSSGFMKLLWGVAIFFSISCFAIIGALSDGAAGDSAGEFFMVFLLGPILGGALFFISKAKKEQLRSDKEEAIKRAHQKYLEDQAEYDRKVAEVEQENSDACDAERNRVAFKNGCLETIIANLDEKKKEIEETLEKLYSFNVLHPKYRELMAVSQIYDYLDTRRCNKLEGHEGAYEIFERELRADLLIEKMDIMLEKLDQMAKYQQHMVAAIQYSSECVGVAMKSLSTEISSGIERINMNLGEITDYQAAVKEIQEEIAKNSQETNMQTEIIKRNTERIRQIQEWEAKKTWFGKAYTFPPV